jgi:hypothetical protein
LSTCRREKHMSSKQVEQKYTSRFQTKHEKV